MNSVLNAIQCAVPCMNGQIGTQRVRGSQAPFGDLLGRGDRRAAAARAAIAPKNRSTWRHITPFGMPVVPPV